MRTIKRKYHYFYKITNNLNNHYYYGIHSTDNLNDGYMGSGTRLRYAYEKYGIENFTKEILKFFETREEAAKHEAEIVNEVLVDSNDCYNIILGGDKMNTIGTVTVKNNIGETLQVSVNDIRYISGELKPINCGYSIVKDEENNIFRVKKDDHRYLSGELKSIFIGKVVCKDSSGKYFQVDSSDERIITGELKPAWCGKKHKAETIEKQRKTFEKINHQQGSKNSQYGTCWITKDGVNKKIKKEELEIFEQQDWKRGRNLKAMG